jgi:hypothetical protein
MTAAFVLPLLLATAPPPALVVHHAVDLRLDVDAGTLEATDTLTLPSAGEYAFVLHAGFRVEVEGGAVVSTSVARPDGLSAWTVRADGEKLTLKYGGRVVHAPQSMPEEHARSFSQTMGIISRDGVYLSRESGWLPLFASALHTFDLTVSGLPAGWSAVSEGQERAPGKAFQVTHPVDDAHVVAGPFTRYEEDVAGTQVVALLRTKDDGLAAQYLDVTRQYLTMYNELLGPYPWSRFALVENFWETGYGMPGFTLLGPKVIRFPFILHSSYPHELLHNWWGNGVYLEPDDGNWCEGLTAYLADHLVAEQRGTGPGYRRRALTRYADHVRAAGDFPLREFKSRRSRATEAIGYGKWLMVLHMLRLDLGDELFVEALRKFYADNRYQRAGFDDLRRAFERAHLPGLAGTSGRSLERFFSSWVDRAGAPRLRWSHAASRRDGSGRWSFSISLEQTQPGPSYPMVVPVYAVTDDDRVVEGRVRFAGGLERELASVDLRAPARPVRVHVDPYFDTFRGLADGEVAPALSRVLGADKAVFVLPSLTSDAEANAWREFAKKVCPNPGACTVKTDKELGGLPDDAAVWVLGYGNNLRAAAFVGAKAHGASFNDGQLIVDGTKQRNADHSVALALAHPRNDELGLAFVGADSVPAIAGLARKLPHYGRYGYLGFEGGEPTNVLKGEWAPVKSPMVAVLSPGAGQGRAPKAERAALASLPPPFSAPRMLDDVRALAAPALAGRAYGSEGEAQARAIVVKRFKDAGLSSGTGGFERCWDDEDGPGGKPVRACNVVAKLPGRNAELPSVVLGAHLDHLGTGWPEARKGNAGKVHPGANDNASGVSVLLQVAEKMARAGANERTVFFVAFTGEEAGLRGSQRFLQRFDDPKKRLMGMVNLDTVGVRPDPQFLVFGTESAREWIHIFLGVGFTTGVQSRAGAEGIDASDHTTFLKAGVPAVQVFGGPTDTYHAPSDTADKVEGATLVAAATLTHEAVRYLANRKDPLTPAGAKPAARAGGGGRKVSLGSIPDFTFRGPGVRLKGTVKGSPAEGAGLVEGDIIVGADGEAVKDLKGLAGVLRAAEAGATLKLRIKRGDEELDVEVVLVAR